MPLPPAPGTYVLILQAPRSRRIRVGRLGVLAVRPGFYLYVGSAFGPGGLKARVERHLRPERRLHWHIDHLRRAAEIVEVWWSEEPEPREHVWAESLAARSDLTDPMPGFGASDCRCSTHLFFAGEGFSESLRTRLGAITTGRPLQGHHGVRSMEVPGGIVRAPLNRFKS